VVVDVLVAFDLLDRQILDRDGEPVGKVDDLELAVAEDGGLYLSALLVGQQVLGRRIGGWFGRWIENVARRLEPTPDTGPLRIPYDLVATVDSAVTLSVRRELLADPPLESWLREHLIGRIPGAFHGS
jgi:sporulation protein YlmC with PRC-barrel domain